MSKFLNLRKYESLVKNSTEYASRMRHLSNRIFGESTRDHKRSKKVEQMYSREPLYMQHREINFYPRHLEIHALMVNLRNYGLFRDEHADFREEMNRLRALRGKGRPERKTKEEGKRYQAKQKKLEEAAKAKAAAECD